VSIVESRMSVSAQHVVEGVDKGGNSTDTGSEVTNRGGIIGGVGVVLLGSVDQVADATLQEDVQDCVLAQDAICDEVKSPEDC